MSKHPNSADDIGHYFIDTQGDVWKCISYCDHPTVGLKRVRDGLQSGGAVGSPNIREFVRLRPVLDKEQP